MMSDSTTLMTRYLLGELSEREQTEFETRYFEDARLFDELTQAESALLDDYVRGRLAPDVRRRFEAHYLADPARRERVRFAEALATSVESRAPGDAAAAVSARPTDPRTWFDWLRTPRFALAAATAIVLMAAGAWLFLDTRRAQSERAAAGERPAGTIEPPRGETPSSTAPGGNATAPAPPDRPARPLLAVALALTVGPGERATAAGDLPTLTVPAGTNEIQFVLTFREHEYARYRATVRLVGGPEVFRQSDFVPNTSGASTAFTLRAPSDRFGSGDYLLTLQGASGGEFEDLSQSIFRVVRQP